MFVFDFLWSLITSQSVVVLHFMFLLQNSFVCRVEHGLLKIRPDLLVQKAKIRKPLSDVIALHLRDEMS